MATVRFYGDLQRYGRKFKLDVLTAGEALHALMLQIPGLRQHIQGDFYRVRIAGNDISEDGVQMGMSSILRGGDVIHLIPRAVGAGGAFQAIAGGILVVAGIVVGVMAGWTGIGASIGVAMIGAGVGMMMGGIAMMLTKTPKTNTDGGSTNNNTSFSNLDNTVAQGQPLPLAYGRMMIGSKVLSQGLSTE